MGNDEKQLKACLTSIVKLVEECLEKFNSLNGQRQPQSRTDIVYDSVAKGSQLNNNIYTFTFNNEENELLQTLTTNIEVKLDEYFEQLSKLCLNYLLDFLYIYHYDRKQRKFLSPLSVGVLDSLSLELKGLFASCEAYPAAYNGQLDVVKKFTKDYPTFKDKPGLWETTLLYSAARNNHLDIVKYLIEEAYCSVNAQNLRDVDFALDATVTTYAPRPTAGSTALHGACFNNHLNIVQYLVEHGADYFIQNQAIETPISNGTNHADIKKFFQDYLIMGYSAASSEHLPCQSIMNDDRRPIIDSMWEYKPFQDPKWYKFTLTEATLLHKTLLPSEEFQKQIYLKVAKGLYSVSITEFLRSGNYGQDPQKNMAWIRCRGSSVLNFDCYSIWQIMLIQHKQVDKHKDNTASLKIQQFPVVFNSAFKLQLNAWYNCDDKTSSLFDDAMDYRRKMISIDIPHVGNKLTINLKSFEFSDNEKTIFGCIRWIPKLVSKTEHPDQKLVYVDNYQPVASIEPIPLTTKRLKEALQMKNIVQQEMNDKENQDDEDESGLVIGSVFETRNRNEADNDIDDDDDDDDDVVENSDLNNRLPLRNNGTWSVLDLNDDILAVNPTFHLVTAPTTIGIIRENSNISLQKFVDETSNQIRRSGILDRVNALLRDQKVAELTLRLEAEMKELNVEIEKEKSKNNNKLLEELQQELLHKKIQGEKLKTSAHKIIAMDYDNIQSIIANTFLFSKSQSIIDHLKAKQPMDSSILGIPSIAIRENNDLYCISVTGTQLHHDEFKNVLQRIHDLCDATRSARVYYQQQLNSKLESINNLMAQVIRPLPSWKYYTKCFQQLASSKIEDFVRLYDDYILQKSKLMVEECITDASFSAITQLGKLTDMYTKKKQFLPELEILKGETLDEYIKEHISLQQLKFEKKPSKQSLEIMNHFINKIRTEFKTKPTYVGFTLEQFKEIQKLLQRTMLYYRCFLLQLPLYESSKEFLEKTEQATVITIATPNGSGKSTLLPALLIANGYDKAIVTQPRRLLCARMCRRVNETMATNRDESKLAGWVVDGAEQYTNSRILYLTDSLLKERLLNDEHLITNIINSSKPIVFFLDEVHERSVDIDLCLALFARLLTEKPEIRSKLKIIISSATLDSTVPKLFRQIPQLKVDEFVMPMLGTLYPVTKCERTNENILDLVQELGKKRQRYDQILCFVSSVSEVNQCCRLLEEISHGTISAFPLIQSQSATNQQRNIEKGSIFFSTTVAETSLTFPSLKYVIDTGKINIPVYDSTKKQTTLMELRAAESTIKQRLGRLGRTKPGEYYSLYDFKVEEQKYPKPQICQSDLVNTEFSLRKSLIKNGLDYLKQYLPDAPTSQAITSAVEELRRLSKS
ncbi:unnamed protein product [Rotaria socialis]|uniref:Uncharacterized protein n=1 Tax=Rotaria socialis TaxID=392032 RepID=A0A818NBF8_9BILA|nr:unnamed protein product [Rotaria socialis]CAF4799580.1 unnamed protein product [Rotaria socialis]